MKKREQYSFYGGLPPHVRDSDTSLAAAVKVSTTTRRKQVLDFLRQRAKTGATDEQIQDVFAMNPSTQRPRRVELVQLGLVKDSGNRAKTRSGRKAVIWVACESIDEPAMTSYERQCIADYRRAHDGE